MKPATPTAFKVSTTLPYEPAGGGEAPMARFDTLRQRADCLSAYSLRSSQQVADLAEQRNHPRQVTYDYAGDPDPRKQDAAKFVVPADMNSLDNQLRLPIPHRRGHGLLFTWETWLGRELDNTKTGIPSYKFIQLASGRIWTEIRRRFAIGSASGPLEDARKLYPVQAVRRQTADAPPVLALIDVRAYEDSASKGVNVKIDGVNFGGEVISNIKAVAEISPETWTEEVVWLERDPSADDAYLISLWARTARQGLVQVYDRRPIKPNARVGSVWTELWVEVNTSASPASTAAWIAAGRGPLTGYVRNITMHEDVTDPTPFLQFP